MFVDDDYGMEFIIRLMHVAMSLGEGCGVGWGVGLLGKTLIDVHASSPAAS